MDILNDFSLIESILGGLILLSGVIVAWLSSSLHSVKSKLESFYIDYKVQAEKTKDTIELNPDTQTIKALQQYSKNTQSLLESPEGRGALAEFYLTEAALMDFLEEFSADVIAPQDSDVDVEDPIEKAKKSKQGVIERAKRCFQENGKSLAGKVFGKLNDVAKGMVPGLGKGDEK